jgi:MFS family permease
MTGGIKHLAHEPVLRHTLFAFTLMLIVTGFTEASIYAVLDFFDRPTTFAGVVVAVLGVGAIVGGLTTSRWVRPFGEAGTVTAGVAFLAVGLAIVALTSTLWVVLAAVVVIGYSMPLTGIAFMTMLQRRTPHALMGRVSLAVDTVMGAPQTVSLAVGAQLVTLLDYHLIFAIMAAFTGAAVVYLLISLRGQLFRPDPPLGGEVLPRAASAHLPRNDPRHAEEEPHALVPDVGRVIEHQRAAAVDHSHAVPPAVRGC